MDTSAIFPIYGLSQEGFLYEQQQKTGKLVFWRHEVINCVTKMLLILITGKIKVENNY